MVYQTQFPVFLPKCSAASFKWQRAIPTSQRNVLFSQKSYNEVGFSGISMD